ncbi:MAG TPA: hypothetical protein VGD99_05400 [Anaerolineae bacterium]
MLEPGTTRHTIPFEHIEVALTLAEALATEYGLQPGPVTPGDVEAAYLRRMKLKRAEFGLKPSKAGGRQPTKQEI